MDLIQHNQVDKVAKLLDRGFDPNYHDSETGGEAAHKHPEQTQSSDAHYSVQMAPNPTKVHVPQYDHQLSQFM